MRISCLGCGDLEMFCCPMEPQYLTGVGLDRRSTPWKSLGAPCTRSYSVLLWRGHTPGCGLCSEEPALKIQNMFIKTDQSSVTETENSNILLVKFALWECLTVNIAH